MRKLVAILLLALSLSACGLFQFPKPQPPPEPEVDLVGKVLSNTVALRMTHPETGEVSAYCSGVAVDGIFVTANHCIEIIDTEMFAGFKFDVLFRGESHPVAVVVSWPEVDLAVIDAVGARARDTLEVSPWEPDYGVKIAWAGYPLGFGPHIFHGFVSNPQDPELEFLFTVDGQFIPGTSGGPVVDEQGRLIGIVSSSAMAVVVLPQLIDIGYAVRPEYIREILETK